MVAMDPTIDVEGKMEGGLLGGLGRMFSGESLFFQTQSVPGRRRGPIAPQPGTCCRFISMANKPHPAKDGFLAASDGVSISTTARISPGFSAARFLRAQGQRPGRTVRQLRRHPRTRRARRPEMIVDNAPPGRLARIDRLRDRRKPTRAGFQFHFRRGHRVPLHR